MDKKSMAKLTKASTTTRGTPRRRSPKGLAQDLRYQALKELPTETLEKMLRRKLAKLSQDKRLDVEAQLHHLKQDDRREFVRHFLSEQ